MSAWIVDAKARGVSGGRGPAELKQCLYELTSSSNQAFDPFAFDPFAFEFRSTLQRPITSPRIHLCPARPSR